MIADAVAMPLEGAVRLDETRPESHMAGDDPISIFRWRQNMASKAECDQYAVDFMKRFDELTQWAIEHWPRKDFPLLQSDFTASRREIGEILGPKLGDGDDDEQHGLPSPGKDAGQQGQYIDMNPMPWP